MYLFLVTDFAEDDKQITVLNIKFLNSKHWANEHEKKYSHSIQNETAKILWRLKHKQHMDRARRVGMIMYD